MFTFVIIVLLSGLNFEVVFGHDMFKYQLKTIQTILPKRSIGERQEVDEQLCELQNNLTTNSMTFMDATGKLPSGMLEGNLNSFGSYHQCLSVDETVDDVNIRGKYCMMDVIFSISEDAELPIAGSMPFGPTLDARVGLCLPNACAPNALQDESIMTGVNITMTESFCRQTNDKPIAIQDIIAIVLFLILGLLMILSTSYHTVSEWILKKDVSKLAKSFSVHHNMSRLTYIPTRYNPLACINGIRAISMIWVVMGHTYTTASMVSLENAMELFSWMNTFEAMWIFTAGLAVDTFFYMTALLLTTSILKKFSEPVSFAKAVPLLYLNRYLRLTPLLAAVILLQTSLLNHVSDGPDWSVVNNAMNGCLSDWWVNLLYLQNYINTETCLQHTWYLALDMQFYFATPIVVIFLFNSKRLAAGALTAVTCASLGAAVGIVFYHNFPMMLSPDGFVETTGYLEKFYIHALGRSPPFVLGIVVGYIMHLCKNNNLEITSTKYKTLHWCVTAFLLASSFFGTYIVLHYNSSQIVLNFYQSLHRSGWALGVGGMIFACQYGFGGPIQWFLGHNMWVIPARLSYAMYLIHYPIMFSVVGSFTSPLRFSDSVMLFRFLSDLTLSVMAAALLHIIVEAPFAELSNVLFAKLTGNRTEKLKAKDEGTAPTVAEIEKGSEDLRPTNAPGNSRV